MISERDIAEKFNVVWKQSFPLLTPSFMRVFNESYVIVINEDLAPIEEEVRFDLVSEAAFNLSQMVIEQNINAVDFLAFASNRNQLAIDTAHSIWPQGQYVKEELELSPFEVNDILRVAGNIVEFINKTKRSKVKFKPLLKGYGILSDLEGDLEIDDTLYEIKTVNRNFKSSDLKQLFIYLALKQVSQGDNWKNAGLYNPRKGTCCNFNIKALIEEISGGKSSHEAFEGLLDSLTREVEIDARF